MNTNVFEPVWNDQNQHEFLHPVLTCKNNHDHHHDFKVLEDDIPPMVISMGLILMTIASFVL